MILSVLIVGGSCALITWDERGRVRGAPTLRVVTRCQARVRAWIYPCCTRQRAARSKISGGEGAAATVHCQRCRRAEPVQRSRVRYGDRRNFDTAL